MASRRRGIDERKVKGKERYDEELYRKMRHGGRRGMEEEEVWRKERYGGRRGMEEGEV